MEFVCPHLETVIIQIQMNLQNGRPWWLSGKEFACQCRSCRRRRLNPCVRKIHWRRKLQLTPVYLSGKCRGQRSLAGYTVHGVTKELDMIEWLKLQPDLPGPAWSGIHLSFRPYCFKKITPVPLANYTWATLTSLFVHIKFIHPAKPLYQCSLILKQFSWISMWSLLISSSIGL